MSCMCGDYDCRDCYPGPGGLPPAARKPAPTHSTTTPGEPLTALESVHVDELLDPDAPRVGIWRRAHSGILRARKRYPELDAHFAVIVEALAVIDEEIERLPNE